MLIQKDAKLVGRMQSRDFSLRALLIQKDAKQTILIRNSLQSLRALLIQKDAKRYEARDITIVV